MSTALLPEDLRWCVNTLPRSIRDLLKKEPGRAVIGGGYIRDRIANVKPSDIDIFAPSREAAEAWARRLADTEDVKLVGTQNAFTILTPITTQIIHRWTYEQPEQIVRSFDFTIAMAAIWHDGSEGGAKAWTSMVHERFYTDLAARRLVYTSPQRNEDAGGSLLRVLKFYQRGYRIPLDSMGAVVARLANGIKPHVLASGDEREIARIATGLLREVDPSIDPEHFAHMQSSELDEEEEETRT